MFKIWTGFLIHSSRHISYDYYVNDTVVIERCINL
jgi:hypothetical protein